MNSKLAEELFEVHADNVTHNATRPFINMRHTWKSRLFRSSSNSTSHKRSRKSSDTSESHASMMRRKLRRISGARFTVFSGSRFGSLCSIREEESNEESNALPGLETTIPRKSIAKRLRFSKVFGKGANKNTPLRGQQPRGDSIKQDDLLFFL